MSAAAKDLTIEQGTSWELGFLFRIKGSQTPIYDASCTVRGQVRKSKSDTAVLHEWSTAAGTATIDSSGVLTLTVSPATSSAWTWSSGVYDIEVTKAGAVDRVLEGRLIVDREVTRT